MSDRISNTFNILKIFGNRKRLIVIIGILAVIIFGLELFSRVNTVVEMGDSRFSPLAVNIQPGQKIIWRNTGVKLHWPASNNHPTHTNYPSTEKGCLGSLLDACKTLKPGESYSFTFDTPGSWGIHDHMSPGKIMVVNVARVNRGWLGKIQILIKSLFNKNEVIKLATPEEFKNMDYNEQLSNLQIYAQKDPKAAWELLKNAFIVNGQIEGNPHELAHVVGASTYTKSGVQGVDICDQSFAYGCFHGVAEAAINHKGEDAVGEIEKECAKVLDTAQAPSCYHGIGHGTAGIHNLEVKPALNACEKMGQQNREYCYDGVFMEQATALGAKAVNKDNPWELCGTLDQKFHIACGRYQPTRLSSIGYDFKMFIKSCTPAPSIVLEEHCLRSSGFSAAPSGVGGFQAVVDLCNNAGNQRGVGLCLTSAATEMTFQAYNGWQTLAPQICGAIPDSTLKDTCNTEYKAVMKREGR